MEEDWSSRCLVSNLRCLNIQENLTSKFKYYIVIRDTIIKNLKTIINFDNIIKMYPGYFIKAMTLENSIQISEIWFESKKKISHSVEWRWIMPDFRSVSPLIFKLLLPISNLDERTELAKNEKFCREIENIKEGSKVLYCPKTKQQNYLVTVKFIGSVPQFGHGYYFGIDATDYPHICKFSDTTRQYYIKFNSPGIFVTLSEIKPQKIEGLESIRNFEINFLSNDILQPKNTDNFFINKNKENDDSKRSLDVLKKNKYPLVDTDNNNQVMRHKEPAALNIRNYSLKNTSDEHQNHNKKLDTSLIIFDPLNPEHKWSSDLDLNVESNLDNEINYSSSSILNKNYEVEEIQPKNVQQFSKNGELCVESYVQVFINNVPHYGRIRWIGLPKDSNKLMAAIELDDIHPSATDGTYQNIKYIKCNPQKAYFTDIQNCQKYDMAASNFYYTSENQDFKFMQNSMCTYDVVPPISVNENLKRICGKYRGIQGHHNSCYLDATLFSMFAYTNVFDNLLFRPVNDKDCIEYEEVQKVLREEIVNPLRRDLFVKADSVMKLRTLLEKSSSISGLTSEEKDPEEFLTSLLAQTLNAEPFLKLSSGQDAYHYQLFVEKNDNLIFPSVQELLEQSFLTSNIKLKELPSCLIIQMPRFGKSYKMYSKIQPTLLLDVTDIIENSPRQCIVCGNLATYECKECLGQLDQGLKSTAFCNKCFKKAHNHEKRSNHEPNKLSVPMKYEMLKEHCPVQRLCLELLAVVCIETSHYVSFVKCAPGPDAPWCFFDSMADRQGEQNGHNIPEMMPCPDFPYWLSKEGASELAAETSDRILSGYAKRLLCDAYMCMYHSPDLMMYK